MSKGGMKKTKYMSGVVQQDVNNVLPISNVPHFKCWVRKEFT